ncbi:Uncharacterised protein [Mycobacteroides abscessus subsp. massiliense]|uniref:hypothetical protein n=1 Tax=Mycobacteroides abscessus TaxID=36809 RepID=UPI0009A8154D|nr:hypothetical protein [Mycobacteroides abscessus]SKY52346.1 Uncharacterised protein [Mycobacteroides abscessus subsp. massiliense]SKZ09332.1 Uncharacterised protein [Mycobacteroides abscessus subsp. massiliense]
MELQISQCVKCSHELDRGRPGRPSRFCSDGCKASTEAEMRRVNVHLRKAEERRNLALLHNMPTANHDRVIADLQTRYDHLAGVPAAEADNNELED